MWGWRATFIAGGAAGFVWLAVWLLVYRPPAEHTSVSKRELDYINSDRDERVEQSVSWLSVLKYRETWACEYARARECYRLKVFLREQAPANE
jgi:MFS transporter, ACS family, hexuronate transporter